MDQTSSSQVKSESGITPISSVSNLEPLDMDTPAEKYLSLGKRSSQNTPRDDAHTRHSAASSISSDQRRTSVIQSPSKQPSEAIDRQQRQSSSHQSSAKKQSRSFLRWLPGATQPGSIESEAEEQLKMQADEINQLTKVLHEKENTIKSMFGDYMRNKEHQQKRFQDELQYMENEFQQQVQHIKSQKNDAIQSLQLQVQELASHRNTIHEKYSTLQRRQQEESFKQMETGRWLPKEESRVLADFERIRIQMRTWAKNAAAKNMAATEDVKGDQQASFIADLSRVAVLEFNQFPSGLSTPKGPPLLLNALLAHDVYTSVFRSPFFFLNDDLDYRPTGDGLGHSLDKIYDLALACKWEASSDGDYQLNISANVEDAHIWRSQTLRLLLPPLQAGNTDGEKDLHQWTEGMIAKIAEMHASRFVASSAQHLIDTSTANLKKLNSIYQDAASVSYMLWTRKIALRLVTLSDMGSPTFDVDDSTLKPHTLVHPDDHEDKLKGRQITLIVHPLLQVYGTDQGKAYDSARVWVPAEVWFDTR